MGGLFAMTRPDVGLPFFLWDERKGSFPQDSCEYDPHQRRRLWQGTALLSVAFLLSASYFHYGRWHRCSGSPPVAVAMTADLGLPKEVQQSWAAHSPYFPAAEYAAPPENCEIVQVSTAVSTQFHISRVHALF